jgi:hypothetical protein
VNYHRFADDIAITVSGHHTKRGWASCLRENLTSSSYGEGLETGREFAQEPRQSFTRQMNFEGTKKPYERQITDQKRKLLDDIRKGIAGRMEIGEGEMESLIATRHKMGYMLNFDRENVLILRKGDLPVISSLLLLALGRFVSDWSDWILDLQEVLCLC